MQCNFPSKLYSSSFVDCRCVCARLKSQLRSNDNFSWLFISTSRHIARPAHAMRHLSCMSEPSPGVCGAQETIKNKTTLIKYRNKNKENNTQIGKINRTKTEQKITIKNFCVVFFSNILHSLYRSRLSKANSGVDGQMVNEMQEVHKFMVSAASFLFDNLTRSINLIQIESSTAQSSGRWSRIFFQAFAAARQRLQRMDG